MKERKRLKKQVYTGLIINNFLNPQDTLYKKFLRSALKKASHALISKFYKFNNMWEG